MKDYEKANEYFDDLFDKNPDAWYNYYFKSLVGAKDLSKAEKITKKQLKQNNFNLIKATITYGDIWKHTIEINRSVIEIITQYEIEWGIR